jgi:hypothetical protein
MQCGPEMHGQASCAVGCGPYWVQYRYSAGALSGSFQGTYADGKVEILGTARLGAWFMFEDCFNGITGATTPCETALGFEPAPVPEALQGTGYPNNARSAAVDYGKRTVIMSGTIDFPASGGVLIYANMDLPDSTMSDCCIVSDPLFLSDKNHVRISGDPVPTAP